MPIFGRAFFEFPCMAHEDYNMSELFELPCVVDST